MNKEVATTVVYYDIFIYIILMKIYDMHKLYSTNNIIKKKYKM